MLSFAALSIDTERSPLWAVLLVVSWFIISALLTRAAFRKGWMKKMLEKIADSDEPNEWDDYYHSFMEHEERQNGHDSSDNTKFASPNKRL